MLRARRFPVFRRGVDVVMPFSPEVCSSRSVGFWSLSCVHGFYIFGDEYMREHQHFLLISALREMGLGFGTGVCSQSGRSRACYLVPQCFDCCVGSFVGSARFFCGRCLFTPCELVRRMETTARRGTTEYVKHLISC